MPPVRFAGAVAMTSLILCAQLSAFLPWYLIGQGSSLWWDSARVRAISAAVQGQGYVGALHPSSVARLLPVNAAISGCLAVWFGSVLLSYWLAFAGRDGERVVNVVVTAGNVLLQFAMFAFAMRVVIKLAEPTESQLESGDHRRGAAIAMLVGTLVVMALVGLVFNAMAHLALRGCGAIVRLWAHGDAPPPAVRELLRGSSPWRGFWCVSRA